MKNNMSEHYWHIHKKVAKRLLLDMPDAVRYTIAHDAAHETPEYKWFEKKVNADATRLFEDPSHYENQEFSFRYPKHETYG